MIGRFSPGERCPADNFLKFFDLGRLKLVNHFEKKLVKIHPIIAGNMAELSATKHTAHRTAGELPNSRMIMRRSFFFGNHNGIGTEEREYIGDRITEFLDHASKR